MATAPTSHSADDSPYQMSGIEHRPYQAARALLAPTLAAHGFTASAEEYEPNRFDSECGNYVRNDVTLRMMYEGRDRRFVAEVLQSGEAFNVCYTSDAEAFVYGVQNWMRTVFPFSEQSRSPEPQEAARPTSLSGWVLKACAIVLTLATILFAANHFTGAHDLLFK